ncbi:MAG: tetratricopeptide repeat protein [Desulfobacterales bacterium]|nr:tetratricopeptide repeat protein [Desulfobacterales bacterium]
MTGSEDAQLHDRAGDPIATLKKVLLTKPDFARIHFELALLLKRAGEMDDAYFHFRQAVDLNPSLDEDCAGHILEIDREFAPEENLATGVAGNDTVQDQATSAAVYEEACSYADQGQMDLAFERLQEIAVTYPEFPTAHNDLGVLFYQRGDHEQAQTHYEKAVELEPDNPVFRKNLADFYFVVQKRAGDAMAQYVQVLEQDPRDLEALMAIGRVCESIGNPDDARGFYTKILDIEPWNDEARSALDALDSHPVENDPGAGIEQRYAQIQDKVGQVPEAELAQELTSLMSDYPDFAPGYNDLGVLATQMGENDTALGHYKKAVQLDPNNMTFKKNLADLLYFTGKNMEEAIKLYTGILSASPEDLEALLTLGQISRDVGRDEEARIFFRQALDVDPLNQMARDRLDEIGEYGSSSQPRDPSPEGDGETP